MQYVQKEASVTGRPSVLSMSLGGVANMALDEATKKVRVLSLCSFLSKANLICNDSRSPTMGSMSPLQPAIRERMRH